MMLTQEQRDWLTLTLVPGVGTAKFIRLLARFRTPGAVLRASRGALAEVSDDLKEIEYKYYFRGKYEEAIIALQAM